jgi:hypothetical protein
MNAIEKYFRKPNNEVEARSFGLHHTDFGDSADHEILSNTIEVVIKIK